MPLFVDPSGTSEPPPGVPESMPRMKPQPLQGDELLFGNGIDLFDRQSADPALPHVNLFPSIWNQASKTYNWRWDEAYKRSRQDALAMTRDCWVMAMFNERRFPTSQMSWHLEPENKRDKSQMATTDYLTEVVKATPNLEDMLFELLWYIWYGRAGIQGVWDWESIQGKKSLTYQNWFPINGDKIQFSWDGQPELMIYSPEAKELEARHPGTDIRMTDRWTVLVLNKPYWRDRFIIGQHDRIDADFFEAEMHGGIGGVGIRHWIYWKWWMLQELLSWACVPLSSEIETRSGFKKYSEVTVGEEVRAWDCENRCFVWTPLLKVSVFKNAPICKLKDCRGFEAECTPNHKWVVESKPFGPHVLKMACEIDGGDVVVVGELDAKKGGGLDVVSGLWRENGISQEVWCPTTKYGTWVMRQFGGRPTVTGNTDFLERVGLSFTIYYYEAGNKKAQTEAISIAKQQGRNTWVAWPRLPGEGGAVKGIDRIEPSTSGAEFIVKLLDYLEKKIERFIIGQSMSSGADKESGLGGSGRAKFAQDTKYNIIRADCRRLQNVLTKDFVRVAQRYNCPEARYPIRWVFDVDTPDPKAKLDATKAFWEIGGGVAEDEARGLVGLRKPEGDEPILRNPQMAQAAQEQAGQQQVDQVKQEAAAQQAQQKLDVARQQADLKLSVAEQQARQRIEQAKAAHGMRLEHQQDQAKQRAELSAASHQGRLEQMQAQHRAKLAMMGGGEVGGEPLFAGNGNGSPAGPGHYLFAGNEPDKQKDSVIRNAAEVERYDASFEAKHKRDDAGKFTAHPGAVHGSSVKVKPVKKRAFNGERVPVENLLTKQETGRVGEAIAIAYLKMMGADDARPMNTAKTNFPIDLIEDHAPTEVKAGLASNFPSAQQWRLTFSKEGKAEKEWYEKASEKEREAWNAEKQKRIRQRKKAVIRALEKQLGKPVHPRTLTVIINPDTRVADIYLFDGFHDRLGWNTDEAKKSYVGSVQYGHS